MIRAPFPSGLGDGDVQADRGEQCGWDEEQDVELHRRSEADDALQCAGADVEQPGDTGPDPDDQSGRRGWCMWGEGLRGNVKIMLGGGAVSQRVCDYAGADAWSRDAGDAVKFAKMFTEKE